MANTESCCAVEIKTGARFDGLNKISVLRSQHWDLHGNKNFDSEMERFLSDIRDKTDPHYEDNKRSLSAIFFLANINKNKHEMKFNDLTIDEKKALVLSMNQIKAVVSLFPKKIIMPN